MRGCSPPKFVGGVSQTAIDVVLQSGLVFDFVSFEKGCYNQNLHMRM